VAKSAAPNAIGIAPTKSSVARIFRIDLPL